MLYKRNKKGQKLQFLNQLVQSFSCINEHILKSHVGKVVDLLFFKTDNIAISEAQIDFWMYFY